MSRKAFLDLLEFEMKKSPEYQVELLKKLAKYKNFAFAPIGATGVDFNPVDTMKQLYEAYKEKQSNAVRPASEYMAKQLDLGSKVGSPGLSSDVVKAATTEALDPLNYNVVGDAAALADILGKKKGK